MKNSLIEVSTHYKYAIREARFMVKISIGSYRKYPDSELLYRTMKNEIAKYKELKRIGN